MGIKISLCNIIKACTVPVAEINFRFSLMALWGSHKEMPNNTVHILKPTCGHHDRPASLCLSLPNFKVEKHHLNFTSLPRIRRALVNGYKEVI